MLKKGKGKLLLMDKNTNIKMSDTMINAVQCLKKNIHSIKLLKLEVCKEILKMADENYYQEGDMNKKNKETFLTDNEYEYIKDHVLSIDPDFENELGHENIQVDKGAKNVVKLPVWMGSMDKKRSLSAEQMNVVLTDKLDGVSCLFVNDKTDGVKLYTRGNGSQGQDITHLRTFVNGVKKNGKYDFMIRGELIMKKTVFDDMKDNESNARNTVSGIVNSKKPNPKYRGKVDFVGYEVISPSMKPLDQMLFMKDMKISCVHYVMRDRISPDEIHQALIDRKNNSDYEIDGIIITKNIIYDQIVSGNPKHAFAYKHNFDDNAMTTTVTNVVWNLSKNGHYKPTVEFEKITINDVNIQKATGFNGKYIYENKIGPGTIIKVQRSGDVIPYITEVVKSTSPSMPSEYIWSASGNDIMVKSKTNNTELDKKLFEHMITSLKFDHFGKKSIEKLYESGVQTLDGLYKLTIDDILKIEGFKKKSATNLFESIQNRKKEITCVEYMVASKCFDEGIGKKTLIKITDVYGNDDQVTLEQLIHIEDVGESRAKSYLEGLKAFKKFKKDNKLVCVSKVETPIVVQSNVMKDKIIVFTGFRDAELEKKIESMGGKVGSSVNKKSTHLVYKSLEKSSKKITEAKALNTISVLQVDDFKKLWNI
jgi:NAD-dependent DNA ligase